MNLTRGARSVEYQCGGIDPSSRAQISIFGAGGRTRVAIRYWFAGHGYEWMDRIDKAKVSLAGEDLHIEGVSQQLGRDVVVSVLLQPPCRNCGGAS